MGINQCAVSIGLRSILNTTLHNIKQRVLVEIAQFELTVYLAQFKLLGHCAADLILLGNR